MRLVLVRHGQTASNRSHALDTAYPGVPLDAKGRKQADKLAAKWDGLVGAAPDAIAVSPLLRTRMTAQPLADRFGLEPMVRRGVRELYAGDLEMNADFASMIRYMLALEAWAEGDHAARMPGAETGDQILARALPVVEEVLAAATAANPDDPTGVIVAHGAMNRFLSSHLADNLPAGIVMGHPLGNTHTVILEQDVPAGAAPVLANGKWHARTWNNKPVDAWEALADRALPVPSKLEA